MILAELEGRARKRGYVTARLDTTHEQVAAQELYRVSGYRVIGNGRAGRFETILFERALR
jgi:ribosomal protein S18 acetylase RimI-like enzyme